MNLELIKKIDKLREDIKQSSEYLELEKATFEMENDSEIQLLCYKKDMLILEYEDSSKIYDKNSKEILLINRKISEIIKEINSKEKVINYNEALKKYNEILDTINKEVFGVIND